MHEFSVMSEIVKSILSEANSRHATRVEEVDLQIGEYTMLGDEQMKFSYEVLAKDTILQGSKINISQIKGRIRCKCGYEGEVSPPEDSLHKVVPMRECPKCGEVAEVVEGRECIIRNIRMVVPDV